ncbi:MAG: 50S ribosomal protein L25 [Phycisphaerales bacterium]|nr:50S ribosomal protein L25 [Phycisphaerales bacterium]
MEIAKLKAEARPSKGSREAQRVRLRGQLPAIIYGHGQTPECVAVPTDDFTYLLDHGKHLLELDITGTKRSVLIKDVQYDHLGDKPIHVDFALVDLSERVTVSVPLEFRGTPVGIQDGGVLDHSRVDIEIECKVTDIPESIRVNVSDMKLGDIMHVRDLELPTDMQAVAPADAIICSIRSKTASVETEAGAAEGEAQQPEIIGRKEKEAESEG